MVMSGRFKRRRNVKACDEGSFTVGDLLKLISEQKADHNSELCVAGADCRYIEVKKVRKGQFIVILDDSLDCHV